MSRQWTDADVAEMLGWKQYTNLEDWGYETAWWRDNEKIEDDCFGLSTPPSPDADANAARYVLPWLEENIDNLGYVCFKMLFLEGVDVTLIQYGDDPLDESQDILLTASDDHFCKALCTAALEAYHAGRMDDAN